MACEHISAVGEQIFFMLLHLCYDTDEKLQNYSLQARFNQCTGKTAHSASILLLVGVHIDEQ